MDRSDFPVAFNGNFRPALTKCKCPICGSKTLFITETIEAFTEFEVINGKLNREAGINDFGGWIGKLMGTCALCGHTWKFRNRATQIEDVVTELDPQTFEPLHQEEPALVDPEVGV